MFQVNIPLLLQLVKGGKWFLADNAHAKSLKLEPFQPTPVLLFVEVDVSKYDRNSFLTYSASQNLARSIRMLVCSYYYKETS